MDIYLTEEERRLLTQLVESRVRELHPTIRRSRVYECTDGLKHDLEVMQGAARTAAARGTDLTVG